MDNRWFGAVGELFLLAGLLVAAPLLWTDDTYPITAAVVTAAAVALGADVARKVARRAVIKPPEANRPRSIGRERELQLLRLAIDVVPIPLLIVGSDGVVAAASGSARAEFGISPPSPKALLPHELRRFIKDGLAQGPHDIQSPPKADRPTSLAVDLPSGTAEYIVVSSTVTQVDERYYVVALAPVDQFTADRENQSWRKLVRILNHEIMNSLTPIISLARSSRELIEELANGLSSVHETRLEAIHDLREATETLESRAISLERFVERYRSLARPPQPRKAAVKASDILTHVVSLMTNTAEEARVSLRLSTSSLTLNVDRELVEQALVNLVSNAVAAAATGSAPEVIVGIEQGDGDLATIFVEDTGPGLSAEAKQNLFVPFYSTKEGGSGIGLALSREVALAHGGSLRHSRTAGRTRFALLLPLWRSD